MLCVIPDTFLIFSERRMRMVLNDTLYGRKPLYERHRLLSLPTTDIHRAMCKAMPLNWGRLSMDSWDRMVSPIEAQLLQQWKWHVIVS